jgi:UPF0716 protein FxsA
MRRGLALLPLGLLLLAVAEIAAFVAVVHAIGAFWALVIILGTSILGLALLRREGIRGWRRFRAVAESGRPPGAQVSNSLIGLFGALLLAMPGFITAAAGLLLLLPPVRALARLGVERATARRISAAAAGDLFGPRRVRVRRGDPVHEEPPADPVPTPGPAIEGEVVEGEVVEGEIVR